MILNNGFVECSFLYTVLWFFFVVVIVAEMDFAQYVHDRSL